MKNLSKRYPIWLCDVWGVVHDGHHAIAPAVAALVRHRAEGGKVIFITNAPRPKATIMASLDNIGVTRAAYDDMVTSGDATRELMMQYGAAGLYHLGPAHDLPLFEGTGLARVALEKAGAVICTGFFDDRIDTPETYAPLLLQMKARGLTMICANPDKVVRIGTELVLCAGSIADAYQKLGGKVLMAGKPFAPIYDLALKKAGVTDRSQVLAIGDGPETDIKGAADNGLACVFISGGINEAEGAEELVKANYPNAQIVHALPELYWH